MAAKALALALVRARSASPTPRSRLRPRRTARTQTVRASLVPAVSHENAHCLETSVCCLRLDARGRSKRVSPVARPGPIA